MDVTTLALGAIILLAVFDLWVGVANDAVNFLNSAIGSRVATRRTILTIAALGVLLGALTSSGLMEVARKGVFDPDWFMNDDGSVMVMAVLAIYLGVMAADVLLLDLFNTFGLPTSTTVSIISELVGASIAVALWMRPGGFTESMGVINGGPVAGIYIGIFLSVVVAFSVSALLMFAIRLVYGWDLETSFPRWGWLWTGVSMVCMTYFVLFKGLKSSGLLEAETMAGLGGRIWWIMGGVFVVAAAAGAAMGRQYRKVLGFIILVGTGALGLAFAGNDLVNFIGPSVAAAQAVLVEGVDLSGEVPTPTWGLVVAGVIMVASLWASTKARRVTDTEVRLASHGGAEQRWKEHPVARWMVQVAVAVFRYAKRVVPETLRAGMARRSERPVANPKDPPYDLLRATVNLVVASLLISIGTASGLPLSTTYITFTSAMGAALGDRTWTRRDASRRLSGILAVWAGWVLTGFIAATGAFIMASIIALGGSTGVFVALGLVALGVWRLAVVKGLEPDMG